MHGLMLSRAETAEVNRLCPTMRMMSSSFSVITMVTGIRLSVRQKAISAGHTRQKGTWNLFPTLNVTMRISFRDF